VHKAVRPRDLGRPEGEGTAPHGRRLRLRHAWRIDRDDTLFVACARQAHGCRQHADLKTRHARLQRRLPRDDYARLALRDQAETVTLDGGERVARRVRAVARQAAIRSAVTTYLGDQVELPGAGKRWSARQSPVAAATGTCKRRLPPLCCIHSSSTDDRGRVLKKTLAQRGYEDCLSGRRWVATDEPARHPGRFRGSIAGRCAAHGHRDF